jgi:hypothetical protein
MPESSVPEECVVTIRMKKRNSVTPGQSWTPPVAEFFMEMYPDMIEEGFSLSDIDEILDGEVNQ